MSDLSAGGGVLKSNPTRIEWVLFTGSPLSDQTKTYKITVPSSAASGAYTFSGNLLVGETEIDTIGDKTITITGGATTTTTTTTTIPYPAYATRSMSSTVKTGGSLTVTLNLAIDESENLPSVGVSEVIPAGWTFVSASANGTYFESNHKIEWLFWSGGLPVQDRTLTYTITAPSSTGTYTFSGIVDYGGSTNPAIGGRNQVTVSKKSHSNDEFIVTLPSKAYASQAVTVNVADSDSKDALSKVGVDVYLGTSSSGKKVAYGMTDSNGTFTFTPSEAGTYTIYVDMSGYKEAKETLTVGVATTTTAAVTTTEPIVTTTKATTTTIRETTTTRRTTTTTPTTTEAPVTTMPEETTTTTLETTETTLPEGGNGGSNMLLIGIIVLIIIVAVVFFMTKGKKGKPAESGNGKRGKREKREKKKRPPSRLNKEQPFFCFFFFFLNFPFFLFFLILSLF